jgi:hypothetical protein
MTFAIRPMILPGSGRRPPRRRLVDRRRTARWPPTEHTVAIREAEPRI